MKAATKRVVHHASSPLRNFHLPLPEHVYEALREEAAALHKPATVVAREAIEAWLHQRKRAVVREAIADYAVHHAGTTSDLDPALERAAVASLRVKKPGR